MLRCLASFGLSSCYLVLLLSLILGTGRQALALHVPATITQHTDSATSIVKALTQKTSLEITEKAQKNSSQASLQAAPFISILLPRNAYSDTLVSSKRVGHSQALDLFVDANYILQQHDTSAEGYYPSRKRLLALQKLRLEGG